MKLLKYKIILLITFAVILIPFSAYGKTLKGSQSDLEKTALNHMQILGALDKNKNSSVDISSPVKRDAVAKLLTIASGLQNTATALKNETIFPDVKKNSINSGYINTVYSKGYMSSLGDKKFHPEKNATLAQICTAAVRALGYTDGDLSGDWPQNYIGKAASLKLLDGINLGNYDGVPRGTAALIVDRLMNTYVKSNNAAGEEKTLAASGGVFADLIVLGNSDTSNRAGSNQVLTDQGIFYTDNVAELTIGNKYRLALKDDKIVKVYYSLSDTTAITIDEANETQITYSENGASKTMNLPDKIVYYYDGVKQNYSNLKDILTGAASIVFAYNNDKIGYEYAVISSTSQGSFGDYIVEGDSSTLKRLDNNQILTDKGILYVPANSIKLEIGHKYKLLTNSNDVIVKVVKDLRAVKTINIDHVDNTTIEYTDNNNSYSMNLPDKVVYYYDGVKQNYSGLKDILTGAVSIVFAYNNDKIGYEYAVISSTSQGSFGDYVIEGNSSTLKRLDSNQILTDKGILYFSNSNIKVEIGHKYRLLTNDDEILKVDKDLRTVKSIKVDNIDSDNSILSYMENGKEMDMTLPDKVVYYQNGNKLDYDSAKKALTSDTTVVFGDNENNIGYEYAVIISNSEGIYSDYVIIGNSKTVDRLQDNQILTDKGILYLPDGKTILPLGYKFRLLVDNGTIKKVQSSTYIYKSIVVGSVSGTTITFAGSKSNQSMVLPDDVSYYYQGVKQDYNNVKSILAGDSTIIFGNDTNKIGFEYAVILDPIYSKPEIAMNVKTGDTKIGSIDLTDWCPAIMNGQFINIYDIEDGDVVYKVSDIENTNKYLLVLDSKVEGKITDILPNRIYPKTIQINNKNYDISDDMNVSGLNSKSSVIKIGDEVDIYLGHDGKVVNLDYPEGEDNANFALELNFTADYDKDTKALKYTVKLLKYNGSIEVYDSTNDPAPYKGKVVTFTNKDTDTVTLSSVTYLINGDLNINVSDRKIGSYNVADNVRVFDLISNNGGMDANAKIVNWKDIHSGTLESGKISYMNQAGDFGNVNVLLFNDVFNEKYSYGVVRAVSSATQGIGPTAKTVYNGTVGINGKDYSFGAINSGLIQTSNVASLELINGSIYSFNGVLIPDKKYYNIKIKAIDSKQILIDNTVYRFTDDAAIYYNDLNGSITPKAATDIDLTQYYSKVEMYYDKPEGYQGRTRMIVISK